MRRIKYYGKKLIKYIFGILILFILVLIPAKTIVRNSNEDDGLSVIDKMNLDPKLTPEVIQTNYANYEGKGWGADLTINFDEEDFHDYTPTDYIFVVTKSTVPGGYLVSEDDPLYWAPQFSTIEEVENSIAYSKLQNTSVTVDESLTGSEKEEAEQEAIKNHLLNNENQYDINNGEPLLRMYESDFTWTVEAAVVFEMVSEGTTYQQTTEMTPLSISVKEESVRNIFNAKEAQVIETPDITFDNTKQSITKEGAVKKHDVINRFVYDGDPTKDLSNNPSVNSKNYSTMSMYTDLYAPRINISCDGLMYLDIFNVLPTIHLDMWLSEDSETTISEGDIQIFNDDQELTEFGLENKVVIFDAVKLSDFDSVYDDTNTLVKDNIKFRATLNYEYKTQDEILAMDNHKDATFTSFPTEVSQSHEINDYEADEYLLVQSDDLLIFQKMAEFDRSDFIDFVVYPNWDDAGRFNVIFATKDQYIFDSPDYYASKMSLWFDYEFINQRTGQIYSDQVFMTNFTSTDDYGERIYYTRQYVTSAFYESENYYVSSGTMAVERYDYNSTKERSARAYDNTRQTLAVEGEVRESSYSNLTFSTRDDLSENYDENNDGFVFVTSEQFTESSVHELPNYKHISIWLIAIVVIMILLPLLIWFIFYSKRKLSRK